MKPKTCVAALLFAACGLAGAGGDHHDPKHGGIVVETKALDFEIVARPELIQVYVKNHDKPAKLEGAKGKVTLLNGSEKTEVELAPVGDRMEAKGPFKIGKGTKGIASVSLAGKSAANARFEVK